MDAFDPNQIVTMERAALDRWGAGDHPQPLVAREARAEEADIRRIVSR
jgi:hypothetical protein